MQTFTHFQHRTHSPTPSPWRHRSAHTYPVDSWNRGHLPKPTQHHWPSQTHSYTHTITCNHPHSPHGALILPHQLIFNATLPQSHPHLSNYTLPYFPNVLCHTNPPTSTSTWNTLVITFSGKHLHTRPMTPQRWPTPTQYKQRCRWEAVRCLHTLFVAKSG